MILFKRWLVLACLMLSFYKGQSQNIDIDLLRNINGHPTAFKDGLFKFTSGSVTYVNIAAPLGIFTAGLIQHNAQLKKDAAYMVGGFLVSTVITQSMKRLIKRDRPYVTYTYIDKKDAGGNYAFPSGHTSAAFFTATSLSIQFPKWYVIAPSMAWASLVGYGRMYQGVHYPSDVLTGAVIGAGSAWLSYKAQRWINKST